MDCRYFMDRLLLILTLLFFMLEFLQAQKVSGIYIFGDSLVDVGNNNYLSYTLARANFEHHGIDYPTKSPTGRFTNGKNIADFLAEKVGLPVPPPYLSIQSNKNKSSILLNGVNFASGGAGILNTTGRDLGRVLSLTEQEDHFASVYIDLVQHFDTYAVKQHLSKSLFIFAIGSNDIFSYFGAFDLTKLNAPQEHIHLMIATLEGHLKRLYTFGARKFVFRGLAQIGCTPALRTSSPVGDCNENVNYWAAKYNEELKKTLQLFQSEHKDVYSTYFDTYSFTQNIIQTKESYGFKEVKAACCGSGKLMAEDPCRPNSMYCSNRNGYFFWDLYHPTERVNNIVVNYIFDGPAQYTIPINLKHLIVM